ncbi:hypothetical protein [Thermomonas sp.]|uniref:tetratricopeptide repeat protein n=1 Tax=Thermomonas sp. TaxID=1971895 RepID=UPI0024871337|nr:hypothetical protein [Thermomonas sp.]MDI1253587.1 hypothetical protein [Thermomonas sp.]
MGELLLAGVLALLAAGSATASEPELPPIPEKSAAELFKDVPAPWRDYLIQARGAERIADPLQRCLAYPDLPGNQWPKGHVEAHCKDHQVVAMLMADAQRRLQEGKLAELDAYIAGAMVRHAKATESSEEIHYFFQQFLSETADAFTADWLRAVPDSAYALTARALYYSGAAERVRGTKFSSETPREDLRRMTQLYDLATPLFRKAIASKPDFLPAWNGMLSAAFRDSRAELEAEAFAAANAIDPGCQDLVDIRMQSLQPRWGGSYEAMLAYAEQLKPLLGKRPLLAREIAEPYADRGSWLITSEEMTSEAADVLNVALRIGSNDDALHNAANVAFNAKDGSADEWKALAYLLQEARFRDGGLWANVNIARMLVRRDPALAVKYATRAVANDPEDAAARYYLAASNYNAKRFEEAEKNYLLAAKDKDRRQASLRELVTMWMFAAGLEPRIGSAKAKPYLDQLIREYPEDGRARIYRIQSEGALTRRVSNELIQDFEKRMDPKDPVQVRFQKQFAEVIKNGIKPSPASKTK